MKRKTLLALAIAGALTSTTASAATFLCTHDDVNAASISCAEIPSAVLDSMTSTENTWVPSPPFVTYYLIESPDNEIALMEFVEPVESPVVAYYYYVEPTAAGPIDLSSPNQWQHAEPRTVTYLPILGSPGME